MGDPSPELVTCLFIWSCNLVIILFVLGITQGYEKFKAYLKRRSSRHTQHNTLIGRFIRSDDLL